MDQMSLPAPCAPRTPTWQEQTARRARRSLEAGVAYFLALIAAGWLFGSLREHDVGAGYDPLVSAVVEASVLLLVMLLASASTIRWFGVRDRAGDRLLVGALAVTLVLAAELIGGRLTRGWGFYETLADITTRPGEVSGVILLMALAIPLLQPAARHAGA